MALTNLAADSTYKEKIVTLGAWNQSLDILFGFNPERATIGQARTVLATCELMANLSLSEQI